jgi:hypothetical protein
MWLVRPRLFDSHIQPDVMTAHETNGHADDLPLIIQGGMGVGVSNWTLARAVSKLGQLGVVSPRRFHLVRRLQDGDIGRRASGDGALPTERR